LKYGNIHCTLIITNIMHTYIYTYIRTYIGCILIIMFILFSQGKAFNTVCNFFKAFSFYDPLRLFDFLIVLFAPVD